MHTYCEHIARDLKLRFGNDFSKVTIVFPNKRACLFLNQALLDNAESAIWAPNYCTISELYGLLSNSIVVDKIRMITRLYNIYKEVLPEEQETLDQFWGWGEVMLSDFDDIDKHLVNAQKLFLNARELKEIDDIEFLDNEQEEALRQFFNNFSKTGYTLIQERFVTLWNVMFQIYSRLNSCLPQGQFPYEGAMLRHVIENKDCLDRIPQDHTYVFVGFNMLSEVEKKLMKTLLERKQALFYWDYDLMYLRDKQFEAGDFIRENLRLFPDSLKENLSEETQAEVYDNLSRKGQLTFISTSTDSIQSRYVPMWLEQNLSDTERDTAIVLCDEEQLMPVLHSIPDNHEKNLGCPRNVNITMGYPMTGTAVHSFVTLLIRLQTEGYDNHRRRFRTTFQKLVKAHPLCNTIPDEILFQHIQHNNNLDLLQYLENVLNSLPIPDEQATNDDILYCESIYRIHLTLTQLLDMIQDEKEPLELEMVTLRRLLKKILDNLTIPFHGEPATGLQVMGVLETRCLDFRNILMLNVGEGFFPRNVSELSLIPNTLRIGFKLTTQRHRIAVYAYYFYRLIQRAENVTFVYNENSSGITKHEMSRFLRQIQAETDISIRNIRLQANQKIHDTSLEEIIKTPEIIEKMREQFDVITNPKAGSLTPTAINRYITCPLSFYLYDVCQMKVQDEKDESIDAPTMGDILHHAAHKLYSNMKSRSADGIITREMLSFYTQDKGYNLQPFIDEAFHEIADITEYRGESILVRNVIEKYLLNLLRYDTNLCPIEIKILEEYRSTVLKFEMPDGTNIGIRTGGQIDRADVITDSNGQKVLRIVDYKTGSHQNSAESIEEIFTPEKHSGYFLQTFLYSLATISQDSITEPVKPVLFYVSKAGAKDYDPSIVIGKKDYTKTIDDFRNIQDEYTTGLKSVIQKIFDTNIPFAKTENTKKCEYCKFKTLCKR